MKVIKTKQTGEVSEENEALLSQDQLKTILHYAPETGNFTWLVCKAHCVKIGDKAGSLHHSGYVSIKINNIQYAAHRLAWLYETGSWPEFDIDHIDGINIPNFNKFSNLRDTNKNNWNPQKILKNNTSGLRGITFTKCGKYRARIQVNGKSIHLGYFITKEDAYIVYQQAKEKYHIIEDK